MNYTNYRFDPKAIEQEIKTSQENLKKHMNLSDLKGYAVGVINRRLIKDPMRYRDYGMYWPALKEVLRNHGHDYGLPVYAQIAEVYKGETDLQTLIMADQFRADYLDTYAIGTNSFVLSDDDPEFISFFDEDMENRA